MDVKIEMYAEEYNTDASNFVKKKAMESLVRIEQQPVIDENAFLKALELLLNNEY